MSSPKLPDVFIVGAARTPIGSFNGVFKNVKAPQLGITAVAAAMKQANVKPEQIEEMYIGNVLQGGIGQAPARQVALGVGCPDSTEATTINKVCASGMKSIMLAAQNLQTGQRDLMVAGGMESMSNTPYYFPRNAGYGNQTALDGVLHDALYDPYGKHPMGNCAEETARKYSIAREAQDDFAIESYRRAAEAWSSGSFKNEIAPVTIKDPRRGDTQVTEDEEYKNIKLDKVKSLRPVFQKENGTVTAANASSINDGASAVVVATQAKVDELSLKPIAKILSFADAACAPIDFPIAPTIAIPLAMKKAGITHDQVALYEINEAFSAVALANIQILKLDPKKVNALGGSVALGHPVGSSGCRIVVTLCHQLKSGEIGVAGVCNGGGGASAMVIQKL